MNVSLVDQIDNSSNLNKKLSLSNTNKLNSGTPKRRLSYTIPITSMSSIYVSRTPAKDEEYNDENNENNDSFNSNSSTPFIKRKCLSKEDSLNGFPNNSPFMISSRLDLSSSSPKLLNDSFETLQLVNPCDKAVSRYMYRRTVSYSRSFTKHKSAPLTCNMEPEEINDPKPLTDISNHFKFKSKPITDDTNNLSLLDEQRDDVTELENLIFGNTQPTIDDQHHQIKQSLEVAANCDNLIGDRSKQHILPVIQSAKHQDLFCISPETLVDVLNGVYSHQIDQCIIVDSRYPYEYDGGHISTALNLYTKEKLYEEMFIKRLDLTNKTDINKRSIIIFHCEFSSERGPSLLRFLRNQDRSLNQHVYPNLFYPELYLLEGGYKSFYETFKDYCEPQTYKPMLHAEHQKDLKHFRAKAKSWEVSRHSIVYKCSEYIMGTKKTNGEPQAQASSTTKRSLLSRSKHFK